MRISDWSSDVALPIYALWRPRRGRMKWRFHRACGGTEMRTSTVWLSRPSRGAIALATMLAFGAAQDRKSVVEGKSVSVRVDLGGRRIITKKNNIHDYNPHIATRYKSTKQRTDQ